jgi:hypothetical protein
MRHILRPIFLVLALASASLLPAQDDREPSDAAKVFFRDFKRAVLAGDSAWVVGHACFPLKAVIDGKTRVIANAEEMTAAYGQIITLESMNAIRRQTPETLVRTRYGVMVGDGQVWLGEDPSTAEGAPVKVCIIAFGNPG